MKDMRGKVTCVTGANSGIGYSVAKSLAARNANVHMICRNQARGEEARSRVVTETGNENVHLHVLDVSDFCQVLYRRLANFTVGDGVVSWDIFMSRTIDSARPNF